MTENPPPPPPEEEHPPAAAHFDPRRRSMFPPSSQPAAEPVGWAGRMALILLGVVSFVMAITIFVSTLASGQPVIGLGVSLAVFVALFVIRKRSGRSPALGAVVAGVGVAVAVFGGCMLILLSAK